MVHLAASGESAAVGGAARSRQRQLRESDGAEEDSGVQPVRAPAAHPVLADMSPEGGGRPDGELAEAITGQFGSFEAFHAQMSAATVGMPLTLVIGGTSRSLTVGPLPSPVPVRRSITAICKQGIKGFESP